MSDDKTTEESVLLDVRFFPALYLQRGAWVLDKLRKANARSVLDIGCGEGSLLSSLCECPRTVFEPSTESASPDDDLFLERIAGLDLSRTDLEQAKASTQPIDSNRTIGNSRLDPIRWNRLDVQLWQGSLDDYNPALADYEFIVSTEVIEHLPEDVLDRFAPMILGRYKPRYLLITTPNYTFNSLFTKPGHANPGKYLDPTGRTKRVFRHDDHKFEWTEEEFRDWCIDAADAHGYEVEISGVGLSLTEDPFGRPSSHASQTAMFTKRRGGSPADSSAHPQPPSTDPQRSTDETSHVLFASHAHEPHPSAGNPSTPTQIRQSIQDCFQSCGYKDMTVRDLWNDFNVPVESGGSVSVLLSALRDDTTNWSILDTSGRGDCWTQQISWLTFTPSPPQETEETEKELFRSISESWSDPDDSDLQTEAWSDVVEDAPHPLEAITDDTEAWGDTVSWGNEGREDQGSPIAEGPEEWGAWSQVWR